MRTERPAVKRAECSVMHRPVLRCLGGYRVSAISLCPPYPYVLVGVRARKARSRRLSCAQASWVRCRRCLSQTSAGTGSAFLGGPVRLAH